MLQTSYYIIRELIPTAPEIEGELSPVQTPQSPLAELFTGADALLAVVLGYIVVIFGIIWSLYTVIAYILSFLFILMYIYATIKQEYYNGLLAEELREEERRWDQLYRGQDRPTRLDDVRTHAASDRPGDWKLAIIEADIILDTILKERNYIGDSLGERLRHITPSQLSSIDDAWEAHKIRNKIAHEGADFVLTKRVADETISRYLRVFGEFGID